MQAYLQNNGLVRAHASNNFEEHGPEKISARKNIFCTPDVDIIPVKPVKADISFLTLEGGIETTKIPHSHMKALDAFSQG